MIVRTQKQGFTLRVLRKCFDRGLFTNNPSEVESRTQGSRPKPRTQKNFEAKDTKKIRGLGQGQTLLRPRTKDTDASVLKKSLQKCFSDDLKKKVFKNFFRRKRSLKFFFQAISTWGNQKNVFADFPQGFWRFPTKFQRFKNSAVLESITGQFSRTWGFAAKDFKMFPRGLHLCNPLTLN